MFGLTFQALFMGRFLVQWVASEKAKRSVIPQAFWYFSLAGSSGLLFYAVVHLHDPVFAIGQGTGFMIYIRNLMLIEKTRKEEALDHPAHPLDTGVAEPADEASSSTASEAKP